MVARMSRQVSARIMTSFGNMQPSQQMCWKVHVGAPAFVAHPGAGDLHDIHFAVGIARETMTAGFVVRTRAFHRGIVLRDMKIDGPGTQRPRHCIEWRLRGLLRVGPIEILRKNAILGSVVAQW